jgi:hypothetical protein
MIGSDPDCHYYIYEVRVKANLYWCDCFTSNDYLFVYVDYPAILREIRWTPEYPCINYSCPPQSVEAILLVGVPPGATLAIKVLTGGGLREYSLAQAPSEPPQNCECELSMNVSPSDVLPQKAGSTNTTSTIMVSTTKPAPPEGCTVNFKVEPVTTIGHNHDGNRPKGTVTPATITIPGGSSGAASAEYKSPEVSGEEKIIAEIKGEKKSETTVRVKVLGLFDLGAGGSYRLTGSTSTGAHPANHYGTDSTIVNTNYMANDYYEQFSATIGINDMSLPWGGLFDIGQPYGSFWSTPHSSHRKGTSVDIDRCAQSTTIDNPNSQGTCPNEWIQVDRKEIERICKENSGSLVPESTIHCEFSQ